MDSALLTKPSPAGGTPAAQPWQDWAQLPLTTSLWF